MSQLPLIPKGGPTAPNTSAYAVPPHNPGSKSRVLLPDWYADPEPTQQEIEEQAQRRDGALARWQEAKRRYLEENPPPPLQWDTWPEAKEHDRLMALALAPERQELTLQGELYRRMICVKGVHERPPTPESVGARALEETRQRVRSRPRLAFAGQENAGPAKGGQST